MSEEITKRDVKTGQGIFHFEYVEYPGPSPMVDVYLGTVHIGYGEFIDLATATDLELLQSAASGVKYDTKDDEWS